MATHHRALRAGDHHGGGLERANHLALPRAFRPVHRHGAGVVLVRELPGRGLHEFLYERRRGSRAALCEVVERGVMHAGDLDPDPESEEVAHRIGPAPSRCPVESGPAHDISLVQSFVLVARRVERGVDALDVVVAGSLAHPAGDVSSLVGDVPHGARAPVCNRRRIERRDKKVSKRRFFVVYNPKS